MAAPPGCAARNDSCSPWFHAPGHLRLRVLRFAVFLPAVGALAFVFDFALAFVFALLGFVVVVVALVVTPPVVTLPRTVGRVTGGRVTGGRVGGVVPPPRRPSAQLSVTSPWRPSASG